MSIHLKARAWLRASLPMPIGVTAGALVAVALAGAFMAGGMARNAVVHSNAARVAANMDSGLSDESLRRMIQNDPSALSLALRYDAADPLETLSPKERALAAALNDRAAGRIVRAAAIAVPAAKPWTANPLDQARQLDCLSQAVYYEARGETPSGQAAVAQVVLNRVRHPAFPKSICAVVYQGAQSGHCQFSFACDGAMRAHREQAAYTRAQRIAERALGGFVMDTVGNATHFHVTAVRPAWNGLVRVAQVGSHIFYRFGGARGAPNAFTSEPENEPAAQLILASAPAAATEVTSSAETAAPAVVPAAASTPASATPPPAAPSV